MTGPDVRICVVGDSFTVGVGDPTGAGWVGPLAEAARQAGHQLTVYGLGVRRDTSLDIARRWLDEARRRLTDGDRYGLVLAFGANDVNAPEGRPRVALRRTLAVLGEVLDDASAASWPVLVVGPPPPRDPQAAERAARLAAGMAQVCADRDVPFADITRELSVDPGGAVAVPALRRRRGPAWRDHAPLRDQPREHHVPGVPHLDGLRGRGR